jgi:hypothetical protein
MTTLTTNAICVSHKPNKKAISFHNDEAFTFCEECEQNIESFYIDYDNDRLSMWSEWKVSK